MNLKNNKKIVFVILGFITFIFLVSVVYLSFLNNSIDGNNPGGSGGDYTPKNKVFLTNSGILYKYLLDSDIETTIELIEDAVLYNKPVSNEEKNTTSYNNFKAITNKEVELYKTGQSYEVTIDNNEIHFDEKTPRDYWLNITVNDGRHFRVDSRGSVAENKAGALISVRPVTE